MKIVIDIPENIYEAIKDSKSIFLNGQRNGKTLLSILVTGVWNGTPLPKTHGRLIDADALLFELGSEHIGGLASIMQYDSIDTWTAGLHTAWRLIDDASTIIEADKAESEDGECR